MFVVVVVVVVVVVDDDDYVAFWKGIKEVWGC
jgi:hypothetical protein